VFRVGSRRLRREALAEQLGQSLETFFRRYAKFIPNLTRQDGSVASRWVAEEGL
jgi:hypothetical protein